MSGVVPLNAVATVSRNVVEPTTVAEELMHFSIPVLQGGGAPVIERSADILSAKFRLVGGEILISKLNPRKNLVVQVPRELPMPAVASTEFVIIRPTAIDARFLFYLLSSESTCQWLDSNVRSVTRSHQRVEPEFVTHLRIEMPSEHVQRRIADFLDDQVARIDNIVGARDQQKRLWSQFLQAEVDAAFEASTLVPVSRLARVLPGLAFPSDGFTSDEADVRLLRGINVGVGQIRWDETVYWPQQRRNEASAFELARGDVVMGMDRPWIGEGIRIARIAGSDLPCLLLQRVAKLQPSPRVNRDYLFWAYQASSFRREIEVELSGLSVPHLSGDQILRHRVPFLDLRQQDAVIDHLDRISQSQSEARACLRRSAGLLGELKRSLITAAVTGEFDVSTADGSRVST